MILEIDNGYGVYEYETLAEAFNGISNRFSRKQYDRHIDLVFAADDGSQVKRFTIYERIYHSSRRDAQYKDKSGFYSIYQCPISTIADILEYAKQFNF